MATIPLSRGLFAIVDDADLDALTGHSWYASPRDASNGGHYASRRDGNRTVYMHRAIMSAPKGITVDHINGDGLDNRKCNLRLATLSQNNANRAAPMSCTGFRGVGKMRRLFRAQLGRTPNKVTGPYRRTAEEAARDYDKLARERFGEFARLNFPGELS